jgi:hypothetical protein
MRKRKTIFVLSTGRVPVGGHSALQNMYQMSPYGAEPEKPEWTTTAAIAAIAENALVGG